MIFSSSTFLFLFLPIVLILYFSLDKKYKNIVLLLSSIYFYSFGEKFLVLVMIASTIIDYKCGHLIESNRRNLGLRLSLVTNIATLGFFKYFNFGIDNLHAIFKQLNLNDSFFDVFPSIALPMGISFYVFQTMSYTIDVYNGNVKANRNFINFATYVTFFPQLVAGPIVRYKDISESLSVRHTTLEAFSKGLERFILGLSKKVLIANNCAFLADSVFNSNISQISTQNAWLGILAYSLQIYFDFSGYSDMAIGLAKMFGFKIPENFNYPYISTSIREFWRRWHISLSSWFRDYLYIPLGGNKKGLKRTYLNLIIVFFITGLWHGAAWNFIFWGLFHGFFILLERGFLNKVFNKMWKPFSHLYTLLVVLVGWVFFRCNNLSDSFTFIQKLFSLSEGNITVNQYIAFFNYNYEVYSAIIIGVLFSFPIYSFIERKLKARYYLFFRYSFLVFLLLISISYIAAGSYNPFIYFRF